MPALFILAGLLLSPRQACAATQVRVGVRNRVYDLIYDVGLEKGFFKDEGLELSQVPLRGNLRDVMNALAGGVVDATRSIFLPALEAEEWRERGFKITAELDRQEQGKPVFSYYLVRKDLSGRIRTFADLKGRVLLGHNPEGLDYLRFLMRLEEAGIPQNTITIKQYNDNIAATALLNKDIDVGHYKEPMASRLVALGLAEVFAGTNLAPETAPYGLLYYSKGFLRDRDAGRRFMAAMLRTLREYQKTPVSKLEALAAKRFGEAPPKDVPLDGVHVRTDGRIDTEHLMRMRAHAFRKGLVKSELEEKDIFDLSFLEHAARTSPGPRAP